jgi:hypothetical protein
MLAFLAEEMTRLHKDKQTEIKGFLTWLEGYLGTSIEGPKNKTKVKEYWRPQDGDLTCPLDTAPFDDGHGI